MDLNLSVICGKLGVDGEVRVFDSGACLIRYLVVVKTDFPRRRVDVLPVTLWEPEAELREQPGKAGDRIWLCGSAQRRYWESADGRSSRVELVAEQVQFKEEKALT